MAAQPDSIDLAAFMSEHLERAEPDLLRSMLSTFVQALMGARGRRDLRCPLRRPQRGTHQLPQRLPGPGMGHPGGDPGGRDPETARGLLLPRLAAGAAPTCRAGADHGGRDLLPPGCLDAADGEAGRDPGHHPTLQVAGLGDGPRARCPRRGVPDPPLDAGPYTFVAADALVMKVREGGRVVAVHVLVATGVNADGHREILGVEVTSSEDGAGWLAFFRGLSVRGLSGVQLVTSDAHAGLVAATGATLPGASWQRCRTQYAANPT